MFCGNCGGDNRDDVGFCKHCGSNLSAQLGAVDREFSGFAVKKEDTSGEVRAKVKAKELLSQLPLHSGEEVLDVTVGDEKYYERHKKFNVCLVVLAVVNAVLSTILFIKGFLNYVDDAGPYAWVVLVFPLAFGVAFGIRWCRHQLVLEKQVLVLTNERLLGFGTNTELNATPIRFYLDVPLRHYELKVTHLRHYDSYVFSWYKQRVFFAGLINMEHFGAKVNEASNTVR